MLTQRKTSILDDIIHTYVKEARPVGSQAIVEASALEVSPATVRNEMVELEEEGYLFQPHTSAGRIPTEKGWHYYLDHFLTEKPVSKREQAELKRILHAYKHSHNELLKHLAQTLADFTEQAAFVAFTAHDTYYTGISKLFNQPEFEEIDLIRNISHIVDHLDDVMPKFFSRVGSDVTVLLGSDNPFSEHCGLIMTSVPKTEGMLGVFGPIRQDYDGHVSLVRFTRNLLTTA